jgi:membrane fusion protein, copper/silver efflux system
VKRILFIALFLVFIIGSFLAGSWYSRKGCNLKVSKSVEKSTSTSAETVSAEDSTVPGTVHVSPEKQQIIGVKLERMERRPAYHVLRTIGRVAPDENRTYIINATIDGWITKTYPNSTGSLVKKNEVLAAFYSPEFLSGGQALLFALNSMDRVKATGKENPAQKDQITQFNINLKQYRDTLKNLGMGDAQIEEMIRTRQYMENVNITSPSDGFIITRNVSAGQRFEKGTELYRIADLSRVWILTDVFRSEAEYFKPGMKVRVTMADLKKEYQAVVSRVLPRFDATSRTLKVRLEMDNPDYRLRPDMFVDVELPVTLPSALMVPIDAVIDSGLRKTVYVDRGNGHFEPRLVEIGWRLGNRVEITKGLSPGERIVSSGTFLIDSESRMEMAAQGMGSSMAKDPVTGEDVSIRKAEKTGLKVIYQQKVYYFASDENRARFEKDSDRFLKKPETGSPNKVK